MWRILRLVVLYFVVTGLVFLVLIADPTFSASRTGNLVAFLFAQACGFAGGLLSWWILGRGLAPQVRFSSELSRVDKNSSASNKSGYAYRIKVGNQGKRTIIDTEVTAKLVISGLEPRPKSNWSLGIPVEGELYWRIPFILPHKKGERRAKVLSLDVNLAEELIASDKCPTEISKKFEEKTLTLEDLLSLGTRATIQVIVAGFDEFSGARKQFVSKLYSQNDIKHGQFGDPPNTFEVVVQS